MGRGARRGVLFAAALAVAGVCGAAEPAAANAGEDVRACVTKVDNILIQSDEGVRRTGVVRLMDLIRRTLPASRELYGDPYALGLKRPPFTVKIVYHGDDPSDGGYRPYFDQWRIWTGKRGDLGRIAFVDQLCAGYLYFSPEPNWTALVAYANATVATNGAALIKRTIELGRECDPGMDKYDWRGKADRPDVKPMYESEYYHPIHRWRTFAPMEELRARKPSLMKEYFALKLKKGQADELYMRMTLEQEVALFSEVVGEDVTDVFARYRWPVRKY